MNMNRVILLFLCFSTFCSSVKIVAVKDKYGRYQTSWLNKSQFQQIISIPKQINRGRGRDNSWLTPLSKGRSGPALGQLKSKKVSQKELFHYGVTNSLSHILSYLRGRGRVALRCPIQKLSIYNELYHFFLKHISMVEKIEKRYKVYYILIISYNNLFNIIKGKLDRLIIRSRFENICTIEDKI